MLIYLYKLFGKAKEELKGALNYAEKAVKCKCTDEGKMYYEMANDEMKHANYIMDMLKMKKKALSVEDMNTLKPVIDEMESEYITEYAKVKVALNLYD